MLVSMCDVIMYANLCICAFLQIHVRALLSRVRVCVLVDVHVCAGYSDSV